MNIKEMLESEEGKAAIKAAVEEGTKGLKSKNEELLADLRKQKEERKAAQDALDAEKTAKEEAEAAAASKSGDVEKIKAALEAKHKKEKDALIAERDQLANERRAEKIDGALNAALAKAGVAPQYLESAFDHIKARNKSEIVEVDGKSVAQIGGKEITEFVTGWAQGDSGKHFVAAGNNSGGGANGSNGGSKAETDMSKLSPVARLTAARESQSKRT